MATWFKEKGVGKEHPLQNKKQKKKKKTNVQVIERTPIVEKQKGGGGQKSKPGINTGKTFADRKKESGRGLRGELLGDRATEKKVS